MVIKPIIVRLLKEADDSKRVALTRDILNGALTDDERAELARVLGEAPGGVSPALQNFSDMELANEILRRSSRLCLETIVDEAAKMGIRALKRGNASLPRARRPDTPPWFKRVTAINSAKLKLGAFAVEGRLVDPLSYQDGTVLFMGCRKDGETHYAAVKVERGARLVFHGYSADDVRSVVSTDDVEAVETPDALKRHEPLPAVRGIEVIKWLVANGTPVT